MSSETMSSEIIRPETTTSETTTSNPITFYDIASATPLRTFAPNPWKTRLSLNLKGLPYTTHWTSLPSIATLRKRLDLPPNRTLPDGTPFPTLPIIQDPTTHQTIGDSFEIALYLEKTYPQTRPLFLPGTTGLTAAWNAYVDGIFTRFVVLADRMPFDPVVQEEVNSLFAKRFHVRSIEELKVQDDVRSDTLLAFERALGELAKAYRHTGGTTDYLWRAAGTAAEAVQRGKARGDVGPWLDGGRAVYADLVVGAWLKMLEGGMRGEEWELVRGWQGGLWGRVVDAIEEFCVIR